MAGRPTKLNARIQARIIEALLACNTMEAAAAYGGIDYSTFKRWMQKGEAQKSGQYCAFRTAIKKAQDEAEAMLIGEIRAAGRQQWQALAWIAERRYGWVRPQQVEITGKDGGPVTFLDFAKLAEDDEQAD